MAVPARDIKPTVQRYKTGIARFPNSTTMGNSNLRDRDDEVSHANFPVRDWPRGRFGVRPSGNELVGDSAVS